jgi:hypothetical protein
VLGSASILASDDGGRIDSRHLRSRIADLSHLIRVSATTVCVTATNEQSNRTALMRADRLLRRRVDEVAFHCRR